MPAPQPTRLFHITAIANLAAICDSGALLSKNAGASAGINYQNIAHQGAQGARARRAVPNPPGGGVHDFVPFYFAPRSPMLYAIDRGNVDGCDLRQYDIVHLETTVDLVTASKAQFVFYDRNATLSYSRAFTDIAKLDEVIAWDLLTESPALDGFCRYWSSTARNPRYVDRMERRQAEFLIKHRLPLGSIRRIGMYEESRANEVRALLNDKGIELPVEVIRAWYY